MNDQEQKPKHRFIDTYIAGVTFRKGGKDWLYQLGTQYDDAHVNTDNPEDYVFNLEREPTNKYDEFAVRVLDPNWNDPKGENGFIGFVPKDWSYEVARVMDSGGSATCVYRGKHKIRITLFDELSTTTQVGVDKPPKTG